MGLVYNPIHNRKDNKMLKAIYFALHFAMIFLGVIIAIHTDMTWIGLGLSLFMTIKFMLMLPDLNERTDI